MVFILHLHVKGAELSSCSSERFVTHSAAAISIGIDTRVELSNAKERPEHVGHVTKSLRF